MKEYILVTGATGFLGSAVCERLLSIGYKVIGIGRKQYGFLSEETLNHKNFYFEQLELRNLNEKNFQNFYINSCIHLASMVEYASNDYHDYHDYTITPALNLLKFAKLRQIKKIVYSSTSSIITESIGLTTNEKTPVSPITNYGLSKYICEKLLEIECRRVKDLACITLRFPAIYGKNHLGGLIHTIKEDAINHREIELYGEGKYLRNILYIQDAVDAIILSLQAKITGYELFTIGADSSLSVLEITQELIKLLNSKSSIKLSQKASPNNFNAILDISKAKQLLSFHPRDIKEGLKLYVQDINK